MKNRKVARFLLLLILVIALIPAVLRFFIPGVPDLMVYPGLIIAVSCAVALIPNKYSNLQESSTVPIWLRLIWFAGLIIILAGQFFPTDVPMWLKWIGAITVLGSVMLLKARYDKEDRLADWIDSKVKALFRRS